MSLLDLSVEFIRVRLKHFTAVASVNPISLFVHAINNADAGTSFNGNSIESPEQATQRVIDQRDEGWDLLKVHPGLTLAEYQAMATTARETIAQHAGVMVAGQWLDRPTIDARLAEIATAYAISTETEQ